MFVCLFVGLLSKNIVPIQNGFILNNVCGCNTAKLVSKHSDRINSGDRAGRERHSFGCICLIQRWREGRGRGRAAALGGNLQGATFEGQILTFLHLHCNVLA